jgi:hypothetical protein
MGRLNQGASLALLTTSLFVLDGCQVIKGIFAAGAGFGVLLVIAVAAVFGGVLAVLRRS